MKRPITIASGQFGDLSLEELCKLVSSIGYEGIEIACQAHINVHKVLEDDAYGRPPDWPVRGRQLGPPPG